MIGKLYKAYKGEGLEGVRKKVISKIHTRYYLYVIELSDEIEKKLERYSQFDFVPLDSRLLLRMYDEFESEISKRKYAELVDRLRDDSTDKCFVVMDKEQKIYGFYCISLGDNIDEELNYVVPANKDTMYVFDDYTFLSRRGKKAQQFAILSKFKMAYDMGYIYCSGIAMKGNKGSEKTSENIGFERCKIIDYYNIFGIKKNIIREIEEENQ